MHECKCILQDYITLHADLCVYYIASMSIYIYGLNIYKHITYTHTQTHSQARVHTHFQTHARTRTRTHTQTRHIGLVL